MVGFDFGTLIYTTPGRDKGVDCSKNSKVELNLNRVFHAEFRACFVLDPQKESIV